MIFFKKDLIVKNGEWTIEFRDWSEVLEIFEELMKEIFMPAFVFQKEEAANWISNKKKDELKERERPKSAPPHYVSPLRTVRQNKSGIKRKFLEIDPTPEKDSRKERKSLHALFQVRFKNLDFHFIVFK